MKKGYLKYLSFTFPVLFALYLGIIVSFSHAHIIHGVTIVHSHPFHDNEHGHTGIELQLLHQYSNIEQAGSCLFEFSAKAYDSVIAIIETPPAFHFSSYQKEGAIQLRAPPVITS